MRLARDALHTRLGRPQGRLFDSHPCRGPGGGFLIPGGLVDNELGTAVVDEIVAATDVAEAEESTSEVLYESPEDRVARLEAENAKFKEAEKRRKAGIKGAENSLKQERDEALAREAATNARLAAIEQREVQRDQQAKRAQLNAEVDQTLTKRKGELEYRGLDDETIKDVLTAEKRAMQSEQEKELAERQAMFVQWSNDRKEKVASVLDEKVKRELKKYPELTVNPSAVIGNLKKHVFAPDALSEIYELADAHIAELKDAIDAERENAGRAKNADARKADNPEAMAESGTGARSARDIWRAYGNGDPSITDQKAREARAQLRAQGVRV